MFTDNIQRPYICISLEKYKKKNIYIKKKNAYANQFVT